MTYIKCQFWLGILVLNNILMFNKKHINFGLGPISVNHRNTNNYIVIVT